MTPSSLRTFSNESIGVTKFDISKDFFKKRENKGCANCKSDLQLACEICSKRYKKNFG